MAIVNEIADSFLDVLEKHAQIDEKKEKALLKMDQYRDFMKSQGFTKDMLTKYDDTLDSILAAEYRYAAKQLQDNISDLIKAGKVEEAKKAKFEVQCNANKPINTEVIAQKSYPSKPGSPDKVTKYCITKHTIAASITIDKETALKTENDVKALFGL